MPATNEKFDQLKVDRLKNFLQAMADKGQARPYEIFVDALKVVPKTEDTSEFDSYELYMNEDTEKLRILIYNSSQSNRNDSYCFHLQQHKPSPSFNGLGDIDSIIQEKLTIRDREYELARLKEELEDARQQVEELGEHRDELLEKLEEASSNKYKLGKLNLIDLGALAIEKFAANNVELLSKMGLQGLSGTAEKHIPDIPSPEMQASFQKKTDVQVAPELLCYLPLLQQLDANLQKQELDLTRQILERFLAEPGQIQEVAALLEIQLSTTQTTNEKL